MSTIIWRGYLGLVALFLLLPLFLVVLFSFGRNVLTTFPMGGLTTRWYGVLFESDRFWSALENSVIVTGSVGLVSTVAGTMAAFALARVRERIAGWMIMSLSAPIMLPPLVIGLCLLSFYAMLGIKLGLHTVILAHLIFTQPFVILIVHARMVRFDYALVNSARDLGASPLRAFFTVTLPIIRPTVIGAALIAMAISLDDFVITFFTIGGGNTLPVLVWGMLRTSLEPDVNALGTVIITATVVSILIALRLTRYRG